MRFSGGVVVQWLDIPDPRGGYSVPGISCIPAGTPEIQRNRIGPKDDRLLRTA